VDSVINDGTMILRRWDRDAGLTETPVSFGSLDELYALCLATIDPSVIDRIIIRGLNKEGAPQVVTFVFQSITVTPKSVTKSPTA
jgi:hypothetical protein